MNRNVVLGMVGAVALVAVILWLRGGGGMSGFSSGGDGEQLKAARAVLEAQAAAWNRGDVEGYMDGYERSDEITFISGDDVTRGWQTVFERYRKRYDTREKMGALTFSELEFKPLSEFYTLAEGRWRLALATGDEPHGRFTLLFRRTLKGWRIVHDHTSSAS
jgi:ketosteroid isomerase-like protein